MSFIDKLKANINEDNQKIERAYRKVGEYGEFIVVIEQNSVVANRELNIDKTLEELGCFVYKGKTYQRRRTPYMAVDGRVQMMVDEHRREGAKFSFSQEIDWEHHLLTVYFESELIGKTVGTAKIGIGGTGADQTNPVENAQTSAVGRALANAGYGLFGVGIASAEEVLAAINERDAMNQQKQEAPTPGQRSHLRAVPRTDQQAQAQPQAQVAPAPQAAPAQVQAQKNGQAQTTQEQGGSIQHQYDPKEVQRLIAIKTRLGITDNEQLNQYVVAFAHDKSAAAQSAEDAAKYQSLNHFTQLHGSILAEFNDYMEANVAQQAG